MTTALVYTRVYTHRGRVAHLLDPGDSPNDSTAALCGVSASWASLWRGTGTQDEAERASNLPTCKGCQR